MSEQILISVIIPTYNRADLLISAVRSVLDQSYPAHEILVCDDGSTDDSHQKIIALNTDKVYWLGCGKNGGPAIPRNIGIRHATGNWIAFLDSDDEWMPDKLQKQVEMIRQTDCLAISTNASRMIGGIDHGQYLNYPKHTIKLFDLLWRNPVILSSMMVSKKVLDRTPLFPEDIAFNAIEDYVLWLKIATFTDIEFVNIELVKYYDVPSTSYRKEAPENFYIHRKLATKDLMAWSKQHNYNLGTLMKASIFFFNSFLVKQKYYLFSFLRSALRKG